MNATSLRDVRINHSKLIISTLFHNKPMTKKDLANCTELSLPTVTNILKTLSEKGLITQGDKLDTDAGRPATYIQPVYNAAYAVGIHISESHVRFALTDLRLKLLQKESYHIQFADTDSYWDTVLSWLEAFISKYEVPRDKMLGVGLAIRINSSAIQNSASTSVLLGKKMYTLNLECLRSKFSSYNFSIVNDSKMGGYAQAWSHVELSNFIYLPIGTTIGGAIVSNRNVVDYDHDNAEFGHMILHQNGLPCTCGRNGCFERYCSVYSLVERSGMTLHDFFITLSQNDSPCVAVWNEYYRNLCQALNNLFVIFDADIVISGAISPYLKQYSEQLNRDVINNSFSKTDARIHVSDNGEFTAAMGASMQFIDHFISSTI